MNKYISLLEYKNMLNEIANRLPDNRVTQGEYSLYYEEDSEDVSLVSAIIKLEPIYIDSFDSEYRINCTIYIIPEYEFFGDLKFNQELLTKLSEQINDCKIFAEYDFDTYVKQYL